MWRRVVSVDVAAGTHRVEYDDGDVENLTLKDEKLAWEDEGGQGG